MIVFFRIEFGQFRKSAYLCIRKRGEIRLPKEAHFAYSIDSELGHFT